LPSPTRAFGCALVFVLLSQVAWAFAVPAFRGLDEFDHAYKAAAVARGELLDSGAAPSGRGRLVSVPDDLVAAAGDACESRPYTHRDNCRPVSSTGGGTVTVATSAAAYNPAYYALVGALALPFSGTWTLVVMRAATALISALLLAWAAATTARWAQNRWPYVGLAVACTPVLLYSTSIVSPNGVQYAAAVLVWSALLGLGSEEVESRPLLAALTVGAVSLVVTHTTGTMWLALISLTMLLLTPLRVWRRRVVARPLLWMTTVGVVALAAAASTLWIRHARTNSLGRPDGSLPGLTVSDVLREMVLWVLQSVGAFPMRDEPAAATTYAIWVLVFLAGAAVVLRRATRRQRRVLLALTAACVLVPLALTLVAYPSLGLAWQGRYGLPLSVGMPILAGWVLSRQGARMPRFVGPAVVLLLGVAAACSVVLVAQRESARAPHPPLADLVPLGVPLAAALALAGPLVLVGLVRAGHGRAGILLPEAQHATT
jgi:hypothetical protein